VSNARQDEVEWLRAQLAEMTAERDQLRQHLDARQELDALLMASAPAADGTGPLPAQRPKSRHAARPTHLKLVRVLIPGAALGALRYAWHAHRAATVAAGVLGFTAATGAAVVVAPHGPVAQAFGAVPAAPAPAASIYGAAPMPTASPSGVAYLLRPGLSVESAAPPVVSVPVLSPPSSGVQPSPSDTSPSDTSQPSPSDTFQALPADSLQPSWQDSTDGRHHHWGGQDSPQPSGTVSAADTSTPAATPADATPAAAPTDAATPTATPS
jgi:hypothetical protein